MNEVSTTIKLLRIEKGINQEQLAEQLHVTRQAVSSWETGKTQPDIDTVPRIAEYFDVSVERLIYGREYKAPASDEVRHVWRRGRLHLAVTYAPEKLKDRLTVVGAVLAMIVSYVEWKSIGWALLHGILNWGYILYYIIAY